MAKPDPGALKSSQSYVCGVERFVSAESSSGWGNNAFRTHGFRTPVAEAICAVGDLELKAWPAVSLVGFGIEKYTTPVFA